MFSEEELKLINLKYFKTKTILSDLCELESQNGDHWMVLKIQTYVPRRKLSNEIKYEYIYLLYHRHGDNEGFHKQSEFGNLLDLVLEIINHDDYRMKRKGRTFFDELLEMYTSHS